jgi:TolA-binding protein
MSTLNPTRKVSRRHELREDTVVTLYARALDFIENKRGIVLSAIGGLVLVIAIVLGYSFYQQNRNEQAMSMITEAVNRYESGEYQAALDGDASFAGLLEIVDDYGSTTTGNLARFYAGDALFRTGQYDLALEYFADYDKESNYLGASAYAGEAAVYEIKEDYSSAGDRYLDAAEVFPNTVTAPDYLLSAARAYEKAGDSANARSAYEQLRDDYPDAQQAKDIQFFISRLETSG